MSGGSGQLRVAKARVQITTPLTYKVVQTNGHGPCKSIPVGVRLSHWSSVCFVLFFCYQNAKVTWISKDGGHLSSRTKSSSQMVTGPPLQAPGRALGLVSSPRCRPSLPGTQHLDFWGRTRTRERRGRRLQKCWILHHGHRTSLTLVPALGTPTVFTPNNWNSSSKMEPSNFKKNLRLSCSEWLFMR